MLIAKESITTVNMHNFFILALLLIEKLFNLKTRMPIHLAINVKP
jgi:hypothetical protein